MPSSVKAMEYSAQFTDDEFDQITHGLVPKVMEDKWFIFFEDGHLYFHRSWTGVCVYRLRFTEVDRNYEVVQAHLNSELEFPDLSYQANLLDFLIQNLLLKRNRPFPVPSSAAKTPPGIFQHHISGTGYPESQAKKRTWKWWKK